MAGADLNGDAIGVSEKLTITLRTAEVIKTKRMDFTP